MSAFVTRTAVLLLLVGTTAAQTPATLEVSLYPDPIPTSEGRVTGLTNIFFRAPQNEALNLPAEWEDVMVAEVASGDDFDPVYAVRYSNAGTAHYLLDTDVDYDFADEAPLQFRAVGDLEIADAEVLIRPSAAGDTTTYPTSYQVATNDDGYVYARVSEQRRGRVEVGGRSYEIALRPSSRNAPLIGATSATLLFIDEDGDGAFQERWAVTDSGTVARAESADITGVFLLGDRPYEVAEVDRAGTRLVLRPSEAAVAATAGLPAPPLSAHDLDGARHQLSDYAGRTVVLEFWSVRCPFSEHARPQLNAIAEQFGDDVDIIAVAKEADADAVRRHLRDHPKAATVLLYDEAAWQAFNPRRATPTIYLIDPEGTVQLRGQGASVVAPLRVILETEMGAE